MNTTDNTTTEEIEAPAYLDDPKVLKYLSGTDANLDRLVLEDGKLWAYSKRSPENLCALPLFDLVVVAFPSYAPAVPKSPEVPAVTPAPPVESRSPQTPSKVLKRPTDPLPSIPKTGAPTGLLVAGASTLPRVWIDGIKRLPPMPKVDGETIRVALQDSTRTLAGYAVLGVADYKKMIQLPGVRVDSILWNLDADGEVAARVCGGPGGPEVRRVSQMLPGGSTVSVVALQ